MLCNAGESIGKPAHSWLLEGMQTGSLFGGTWHYLSRLQVEMLFDLEIPLQIYLKICAHAKICARRHSRQHCSDAPALNTSQGTSVKQNHEQLFKKNEVDLTVLIQKYLHGKNRYVWDMYLFLKFNIDVDLCIEERVTRNYIGERITAHLYLLLDWKNFTTYVVFLKIKLKVVLEEFSMTRKKALVMYY